MIQLQLNSYTLGVVDVPDGAMNLIIVKDQLRYKIDPLKYWWDLIKLPHGQWVILGRKNDITEEQAAGLVHWFELAGALGYRDYSTVPDMTFPFKKATESLQSFFRSQGIEGNPLIILNEKV